jgi:hypothetical protein
VPIPKSEFAQCTSVGRRARKSGRWWLPSTQLKPLSPTSCPDAKVVPSGDRSDSYAQQTAIHDRNCGVGPPRVQATGRCFGEVQVCRTPAAIEGVGLDHKHRPPVVRLRSTRRGNIRSPDLSTGHPFREISVGRDAIWNPVSLDGTNTRRSGIL